MEDNIGENLLDPQLGEQFLVHQRTDPQKKKKIIKLNCIKTFFLQKTKLRDEKTSYRHVEDTCKPYV